LVEISHLVWLSQFRQADLYAERFHLGRYGAVHLVGLSRRQFQNFFKSLREARIGLFIAANVTSFFLWWLGDTLLFTMLFNFFHDRRTRFRELLPGDVRLLVGIERQRIVI
jgi:hypothetical protein